jgi:leucyl-tRNA synthetase
MMFTAPPELSLEWSDEGVEGSFRFLKRLWKLVHGHVAQGPVAALDPAGLSAPQKELRRLAHATLAKVTDDIGRRRVLNTAIAAVMELLNAASRSTDASPQGRAVLQELYEFAVICLSPIVPHVTHALWAELGHEIALIDEHWPKADGAALAQDSYILVLQVNGKLRGQATVPADADAKLAEAAAMADATVQKFIGDKPVRKVVFVPGKLVNVVV